MKVSYGVEIDKASVGRGTISEEGKRINEFVKTEELNMCFEYDTAEEAKKRVACVSGQCKRINESGLAQIYYAKRGNKIYILRGDCDESQN